MLLALLTWWALREETGHCAQIIPGRLYTASYANAGDFTRALGESKAAAVLLMSDPVDVREPEFEVALVAAARARLRTPQVEIVSGSWPTPPQIEKALKELTNPRHHPALLASKEGVRRPGMFAAAYLASVEKMSKPAIVQRLRDAYGSAPGLEDVLRFLDVYDPEARRMTTSLPLSRE